MSDGKSQLLKGFFALLVAFVAGGWLLFWFMGVFSESDKSIQAAIIAATVAVFSLAFTFWKERSRTIKEAHRDKKIEVYSIFYDIVFDLLRRKKGGRDIDLGADPNFQDRWFSLSRGVLFYGSPAVVSAMNNFKTNNENRNAGETMKRIGDIYLAMRKDIGLSNWGLDNISIHQIYVSDDVRKMFISGAANEHP